MFRNYLLIAFRTLGRQKMFSLVCVFGLALAMSVCMVVMLGLKDQLSYDTFHPSKNNIYRVIAELRDERGNPYRYAGTPLPLMQQLNSNYDIIEKSSRMLVPGNQTTLLPNGKKLSLDGVMVDPSFFDLFGFRSLEGNTTGLLNNAGNVVLSQGAADKLFGKDDKRAGRVIEIEGWGSYTVSAVLDASVGQSHLDHELYFSLDILPALEKNHQIKPAGEVWNNFNSAYTYVTLKNGVGRQQLNKALAAVSKKLIADQPLKGKENLLFEAQPFNKIILGEELLASTGKTGSRSKAWAEIAIALLILLSACFNYTNLSIARSLYRGKEVGIRKVAGARRFSVFVQFILESFILSLISFGLAFVFLKLMIDHVDFIRELLPATVRIEPSIVGWFFLFTLFTGLLAGALPAWVLSSFKPVQVLKNLSSVKLFGSNNLRKSLLVVQFTLSLVIVIFAIVVSRQFRYMSKADPLFNRDQVVSLSLDGADYRLAVSEMGAINGVENITAVSQEPGKNVSGNIQVRSTPAANPVGMDYYDVDASFVPVLKLKWVAGNNFPVESVSERYIVINEAASRALRFRQPADAVGQQVILDDSIPVQITGVVRDFNFRGMEFMPGPLVLRSRPEQFNRLLIRTAQAGAPMMAKLEGKWKDRFPRNGFDAYWLKDKMEGRYAAAGINSLLVFLAFIVISIASLGLLGMVTYLTRVRHKEIGIRKVLGASVTTVMYVLSATFIRLIVIAGLIGLPLGYLSGYLFLNSFVNRIQLGAGVLLMSFGGLVLLMLIVIGGQVYKVALTNPVDSLRSE